MTDNLVKRLRSPMNVLYEYAADDGAFLREAAGRIEELQRQLAASDEEIRALRDEIENLEYEMCEMENRS